MENGKWTVENVAKNFYKYVYLFNLQEKHLQDSKHKIAYNTVYFPLKNDAIFWSVKINFFVHELIVRFENIDKRFIVKKWYKENAN